MAPVTISVADVTTGSLQCKENVQMSVLTIVWYVQITPPMYSTFMLLSCYLHASNACIQRKSITIGDYDSWCTIAVCCIHIHTLKHMYLLISHENWTVIVVWLSLTLSRLLMSNCLAGGLIVHSDVDSLGKTALTKSELNSWFPNRGWTYIYIHT